MLLYGMTADLGSLINVCNDLVQYFDNKDDLICIEVAIEQKDMLAEFTANFFIVLD